MIRDDDVVAALCRLRELRAEVWLLSHKDEGATLDNKLVYAPATPGQVSRQPEYELSPEQARYNCMDDDTTLAAADIIDNNNIAGSAATARTAQPAGDGWMEFFDGDDQYYHNMKTGATVSDITVWDIMDDKTLEESVLRLQTELSVLAARQIQRTVRGWLVRRLIEHSQRQKMHFFMLAALRRRTANQRQEMHFFMLAALRRRAATRHCSAEVVQRSWRAYRLRVERWQYGGERDEAPGEAARHRGAAAEDGVERRCGAAGEKRWSLYHPVAIRAATLAGGQPPEWPNARGPFNYLFHLRRIMGSGTASRKLGGSARSVHHEGSARSGLARRKMEKTAAAAATKSLRLEARGL